MQCIANFTFGKTKSALCTHPDKFSLHEKTPIELIPGKSHILNFSATDEANRVNLSHLVYRTSVTNSNVSIDQAFLEVSNNAIKVLGQNGSRATLQLFTADISVSFNIIYSQRMPTRVSL